MKKLLSLILAVSLVFGGTLAFTTKVKAEDNGQNGTTLSADVSANGYWIKNYTYDWTIDKSVIYNVDPEHNALVIDQGQTKQAEYTLDAQRGEAQFVSEEKGFKGDVTVTNGGGVATQGLSVIVQLQSKTDGQPFADVPGVFVPAKDVTELEPGETKTFSYELSFDNDPSLQYRVVAHVSITNHSGYLGQNFGPDPKADLTFPQEPTSTYTDATATIDDQFVSPLPIGYTVVASGQPKTIQLTDSKVITYTADITNVNAPYDQYDYLNNTVSLVEDDSKETHVASAQVVLYNHAPQGQALTIGYWKTHAGFTGNNPDRVTQYLPISLGSLQVTTAQSAVDIFNMSGDASNGINKLYAQLLAAKLNIKNGAPHSSIDSVIAAADNFLNSNTSASWNALNKNTKNIVLNWMTALDNYNNGLTI